MVFLRNAFFVLLCLVAAAPVSTDAFRAPENPTGLTTGLRSPLVVKPTTKESITINTATIEEVGKMLSAENAARISVARKRWAGIDLANDYGDHEYWYNPSIHTFGNVGVLGALHAALAPITTKIIDVVAYDGQDVRSMVAKQLSDKVKIRTAKVLDMCCGVGVSTRALQDAFPDSEFVYGVDTSPEMINMAGFLTDHVDFFKPLTVFFTKNSNKMMTLKRIINPEKTKFRKKRAKCMRGNAEKTNFPGKSFDLVTIMYAFHEAPKGGRDKILKEAYRVLQPGGTLAVIDISTNYQPSKGMLAGEPYVLEYQKNIHRQMRTVRGFSNIQYKSLIEDHVGMWTLKRTNL